MKNHKTIFTVLILTSLLILFVYFIKNNLENKSSDGVVNIPIQNEKDPFSDMSTPITRQRAIDHVMWEYRNNQQNHNQEFIVGDKNNIIVSYYQWETESDSGKGSGLLIFEINEGVPKLIWENDHIASLIPNVKSVDMTGDEKNELLVLWQGDKYETLYIYELKNDDFILLTPRYQPWLEFGSKSYSELFNAKSYEIQVSDLDNDNIPEVWFPVQLNSINEPLKEKYVAYKWNGSKYFLWKEQKEPFGEIEGFQDLK